MRSITLLATLFVATLILAPITALAQEVPPPAESAVDMCVGEPSWETDDSWKDEIRDLDASDCEEICKTSVKTCVSMRKGQAKCGKAWIKGVGKIAGSFCKGWDYTKSECKVIKDDIKIEQAIWGDMIDAAIDGCYVEGSDCYAECR